MDKINILITGAGGQGVVLSSDMMGEVALAAGYDVKKTDIHGMAQRGGSVISHVRIADKVFSPLSKEGEVDILLGLEKLEAARWGYFLKPGGIAIINDYALPPLSVTLGLDTYPANTEITNQLKQSTDRIYFVEGTKLAAELGDVRTLNILILGCASTFLPVKVSTWKEVIRAHLPEKIHQINLAAFERGRKEIQSGHI